MVCYHVLIAVLLFFFPTVIEWFPTVATLVVRSMVCVLASTGHLFDRKIKESQQLIVADEETNTEGVLSLTEEYDAMQLTSDRDHECGLRVDGRTCEELSAEDNLTGAGSHALNEMKHKWTCFKKVYFGFPGAIVLLSSFNCFYTLRRLYVGRTDYAAPIGATF